MKLRTLAAACVALASLSATAAFAADPVSAKLSSPLAEPVKFIAGGAVFQCEGDTCLARATVTDTYSTDTCKQVAAKVGPIAAFVGRRTLDDAHLAQCNASAVAAKAQPTTIAKQ